jgi:TolB-like protein/Tfp pilus assembly protein PilF
MSFFDELKRRNVFKVGIAYLVGSWLLIQVADILLDNIGAPAWVLQALFVALGVGFFITLFFAWAFEMTPEGVKREKDVDRNQSITPQTGKKLNNAILVLMAVAIAYLLFDKFSVEGPDPIPTPATGVAENSLSGEPDPALEIRPEAAPVINRQSIAVLPFDNRSNREEDQFFTDGIHDDLLTTIAKIGSMKVISRTSVMEYKGTTKKIPDIAKELGVANVLEGGIQRSGNQVRINVQLIDAETDEHLWAEIYDRKLTAENLFVIQSEISRAIADALHATLSPEEQERINTAPTGNLQAYDAYMRGRQLMATRETTRLKLATEEFNKATELDPMFALAWVGVADSHWLLSLYGSHSEEELLPIREEAVKNALAIDKNLGEAYASLAAIHRFHERDDEAETAYRKALELSPNYAPAYHWYSNLLGNYPLRIQEQLDLARKAVELDPRSSIIRNNLAGRYFNQGLYTLAEAEYQKVIELDPDFAVGYRSLAELYLFVTSQYDKALPLLHKAIELDAGELGSYLHLATIYQEIGDLESASKIRDMMISVRADDPLVGFADVLINATIKNPDGTREAINWLLPKWASDSGWLRTLGFFALTQGDIQRSLEI